MKKIRKVQKDQSVTRQPVLKKIRIIVENG